MDAFEFSKHLVKICSQYPFIQSVEIQLLDEPVVKIKANIDIGTFINIFYNAETSKYSFALIKQNKRIFGVDNSRNWHIHPFENPESHIKSQGYSISDFLEVLESNKDKWYIK